MLNVGIIGVGNAGNQVAALANATLKIPVVAINSSDKDLETVPDGIIKKKISDAAGKSNGAGKDRRLAKSFLKDSVQSIVASEDIQDVLKTLDFCFIVSSTGGGTGSGIAPLLTSLINSVFPDLHTILVGILPVESEALSAHVNTVEYLNELYQNLPEQPYMLYDNDKYAGDSAYHIMNTVNDEIVKDIDVLRCSYNYTTKYASIDDRDMTRMLITPGRVVVARLDAFKDKECDNKNIESMLIDVLKRNAHAEFQRDKKVDTTGIIVNLSQPIMEEFNDTVPSVVDFIGEPIHSFQHIHVNEERKLDNSVFYILTGLTPINDKIGKIEDRIEDINEKRKSMQEENLLGELDITSLSNAVADKVNTSDTAESVNILDTFAKFGL
jgi:cell division GTPase FtsZ